MSSSRSSSLNGYGSLDIRKSECRAGSLLVGGVSGSPGTSALAPLWFFVLGTWERERMGGLIGGKLGRDAMEIRNET